MGGCHRPMTDPQAILKEWERIEKDWNKKETITVDPITGGMKGTKEVELHGIPWESLAELGRVFKFGANKYEDYNFRRGYKWSLSYDALQRHLWLFWSREDKDEESGLHHLAHAAWHCLILLFYSITGRGTDDRPTN